MAFALCLFTLTCTSMAYRLLRVARNYLPLGVVIPTHIAWHDKITTPNYELRHTESLSFNFVTPTSFGWTPYCLQVWCTSKVKSCSVLTYKMKSTNYNNNQLYLWFSVYFISKLYMITLPGSVDKFKWRSKPDHWKRNYQKQNYQW